MRHRLPLALILLLIALGTGLKGAATIYLATSYGPMKSTDGGATFQQLTVEVTNPFITQGIIHPAFSIAVDPKNANVVYFTEGSAFFKSVDGGQSWSAVVLAGFNFSPPPGRLAIDPALTNVLYAVAHNGEANVVIKSVDAGITWSAAPP